MIVSPIYHNDPQKSTKGHCVSRDVSFTMLIRNGTRLFLRGGASSRAGLVGPMNDPAGGPAAEHHPDALHRRHRKGCARL